MDYMKDYEDGCEVLHEKFRDSIRKIKNNGMSGTDLDQLEKLTHSMVSIKKMMKMEDDGGSEYSGRYPYWMGGAYADGNGGMGGMSNGGSYARGRSNARRDSMGRYSGERGYSRNTFADDLRELMDQAPDERTRQKIQRMAEELENA